VYRADDENVPFVVMPDADNLERGFHAAPRRSRRQALSRHADEQNTEAYREAGRRE
jgi:hypothetical protein